MNAQSSECYEDDIEAIRDLPLAGLVLPKAYADGLSALDAAGLSVVAMIEDARGVRDAYEIALHPQVVRLALGGVDFSAELALGAHPHGLLLLHARSRLVIDSAAAGIAAPIDTPHLYYRDDPELRASASSYAPSASAAKRVSTRGKSKSSPPPLRRHLRKWSGRRRSWKRTSVPLAWDLE